MPGLKCIAKISGKGGAGPVGIAMMKKAVDLGESESNVAKGSRLFLLEGKKRYFCNCKTSNLCAIM